MSNVIDFNNKRAASIMPKTPPTTSLTEQIISELYVTKDTIKEIIVFVKFNNDELVVSHSGPTLSDKCMALQLLQHDINLDIQELNKDD